MTKYLFLSLLILLTSNSYALDCKHLHDNVTETEIDKCSYQDYVKVDQKLNKVYSKIITKYKNYPEALHNTIRAERVWIKFRDAQLAMKYPPLKKGHYYGRIQVVLIDAYLERLTKQRIDELIDILNDDYLDELNS